MRFPKAAIFLAAIFLIALALRVYKLSSFEYKNDQLYAIQMAEDTRKAHFLITHGVVSGVGINNPPFFLYLMAIVTFFSQDPFWVTAFFVLVSTFGLLLAIRYFYLNLPLSYSIPASVTLALSPAFTNYTAIIWPQCLMPFLMILYHKNLLQLIKENSGKFFLYLCVITTLVAQFHMSGFFLYPLLLIAGFYYRRKIKVKWFILSIFCILLLSAPFLYHIFAEGEIKRIMDISVNRLKPDFWKIFREHSRMASFDFFRYYFRRDFNLIIEKAAGNFRFILYPLSWILTGLFAGGFLSYVFLLIKNRKLFDSSSGTCKKYPLPFQAAGFVFLFLTLGLLICRVDTPLHYLMIFFPTYGLLIGYPVYRLWRFMAVRALFFLSVFSTACLLSLLLLFIDRAGGYPKEYGPGYHSILTWKKAIWASLREAEYPQITIKYSDRGKFSEETVLYEILRVNKMPNYKEVVPINLEICWNKDLMRYEYKIKK